MLKDLGQLMNHLFWLNVFTLKKKKDQDNVDFISYQT